MILEPLLYFTYIIYPIPQGPENYYQNHFSEDKTDTQREVEY